MSPIEVLATLFNVGMFLSGLSVAKQLKDGRGLLSARIPAFPAVATFVNCTLWSKYGLRTNDPLMVMVNAVGIITSVYLAYCHYTTTHHKQTYLEKMLAAATVLVITIFVYINYFAGSKGTDYLGIAGCVAAIAMFGSPLVALKAVITTQNTSALSLPLSVTSLITSFLWAWYGYTIHDSFVFTPNLIGSVLAVVQCSMFLLYQNPKTHQERDIPL
ncbi:Sugar transporter [Dimargaris xerosporica]|nr:Sugar transporter [Dimargaris xerosporica]